MAQKWAELLMLDHETTEKVFEAGVRLFEAPQGPNRELLSKLLHYLAGYVEACHNKKEEDHVFPLAEKRGIPSDGGPLAVMLMEHEQSRTLGALFKQQTEAYVANPGSDASELKATYLQYIDLLKNHYWKENDILYPAAQRLFSDADAQAILDGIEAVEATIGPNTRAEFYALAEEIMAGGAIKDLVYGLDYDILGAILNALPLELSFVDAADTVRYFSHENLPKIFPRTRGAIGMKVQNCHPEKSVHLVNRILSDFKAGECELAEFWIDLGATKAHIRYWAVRSADGKYLGCLETVQDIAAIQKLEGQHRLLDDA